MDERELDRLQELASIGAGHAATAFAKLTGHPVWMEVPRVRWLGDSFSNAFEAGSGEWSTGVFFEFEGYLDAVVGILFSGPASERVVRQVVGMEEGELPPHCIESALMEVGNILASHVASAIADTVGQRLLPSIPTLAMNHAELELQSLLALRHRDHPIRIECELRERGGDVGGLLVLIPELTRDA